jgi:sn-glycerol 3-phosphate transport system permease protein
MYANSLVMAAIITASQLLTSALAAYAFVFLRFRGSAVVFALFLSTLMVPAEATFIPNYLTLTGWGLGDTYAGLVLPFLAYAFGTFLLRQSFKQFPRELYDAARMDGMGHLRFLWTILLPLSKPALTAVGMYVLITGWNMYFWPLIITRSTEMQTLQIGLYSLKTGEAANPGLLLAGAALSVLPTLALVILGQRFIVRGLTAGAVK